MRRRLLGLAAFAAASLLAGCKASDPYSTNYLVQSVRFQIYPMTGAPAWFPSAISISSLSETRAVLGTTGLAPFDVAFDLDAGGNVVAYPVRAFVIAPSLTTSSVALRKTTTPFDSLRDAPTDAFVPDTAQTVAVGQTLLIRTSPAVCLYSLRPVQYSKVVVDSVSPTTRAMYLRLVANPNCGKTDLNGSF